MEEILNWCKENIKGENLIFEINNGMINITGNCYINNNKITELPYKINKVKGNFTVAGNPLEAPYKMNICSLKNFPEVVTGSFNISLNPNLESLVGGPVFVGGHYKCNNCKLTNLDGIASTINSYIEVYANPLTNIDAINNVSGYSTIDISFCSKIIMSDIYLKLKKQKKLYI